MISHVSGFTILAADLLAVGVSVLVAPVVFMLAIMVTRRVSVGLLILCLGLVWFIVVSVLNKRRTFRC